MFISLTRGRMLPKWGNLAPIPDYFSPCIIRVERSEGNFAPGAEEVIFKESRDPL